jgi:pimeloyl-ACP methyl ester carboxylesterase
MATAWTRNANAAAALVSGLAVTLAPHSSVGTRATSAASAGAADRPAGAYAAVNGLRMYYETSGSGEPLVLLHGAFLTVDSWAPILSTLARTRRVIAVELQGHGHTADIDRPLSFGQMADDVAALLREIKVETADVFGYSMGGTVGVSLAVRHPALVRKLVIQGSTYSKEGWEPQAYEQFRALPADFAPPPLKNAYDRVAPDPSHWPVLVAKLKKMELEFEGIPEGKLKALAAPTLIVMGDREGLRPEHAVAMYRLIPKAQLAILPGADHFLLFTRADELLALMTRFLDGAPTTTTPR